MAKHKALIAAATSYFESLEYAYMDVDAPRKAVLIKGVIKKLRHNDDFMTDEELKLLAKAVKREKGDHTDKRWVAELEKEYGQLSGAPPEVKAGKGAEVEVQGVEEYSPETIAPVMSTPKRTSRRRRDTGISRIEEIAGDSGIGV